MCPRAAGKVTRELAEPLGQLAHAVAEMLRRVAVGSLERFAELLEARSEFGPFGGRPLSRMARLGRGVRALFIGPVQRPDRVRAPQSTVP